MSKRAIAVIINDIHYNINTLDIADTALNLAVDKANDLYVPLIVAGDLHDTKANMRAECVNAIYTTLSRCSYTYLLRGNHDSWNEKSEVHSLSHFDSESVWVVNRPEHLWIDHVSIQLVPYFSDPNELRAFLSKVSKEAILIMHQGLTKTNSGHYIQDHSAINPEDVAGRRVISGHYHTRQDIKLPDGGLWSYTGNPYTLNYAEANDPEKGFHVLYEDGSLEFIPTNLRKHVVIEVFADKFVSCNYAAFTHEDLIWVKVTDTKKELLKVTKDVVSRGLHIKQPFKLELIPIDSETKIDETKNLSQIDTLDLLIDSLTNTTDKQKSRLKQLWKAL